MQNQTVLGLPLPQLEEGRFASIAAYTDEGLYRQTGVRIAFTLRWGGESEPPFDSLNLSPYLEDSPEIVERNKAILFDAMGCAGMPNIQPHQVHGDVIVECLEDSPVEECAATAVAGADAVIVDHCGVSSLLCFADCVPVIIATPNGAFAVVHAGWRGVDNLIAQSAVLRISKLTGQDSSTFNVYIGPYIHRCHFEVGEDLHRRFVEKFGSSCDSGENRIDLGEALRIQLCEVGIDPARIADVGVCTVCDAGSNFYSYRATSGVCGRHGAFAVRLAR